MVKIDAEEELLERLAFIDIDEILAGLKYRKRIKNRQKLYKKRMRLGRKL